MSHYNGAFNDTADAVLQMRFDFSGELLSALKQGRVNTLSFTIYYCLAADGQMDKSNAEGSVWKNYIDAKWTQMAFKNFDHSGDIYSQKDTTRDDWSFKTRTIEFSETNITKLGQNEKFFLMLYAWASTNDSGKDCQSLAILEGIEMNATYKNTSYTYASNNTNYGSASGTSSSYNVMQSNGTATATPNTNYYFANWTGGASGNTQYNNQTALSITAPSKAYELAYSGSSVTLTANFTAFNITGGNSFTYIEGTVQGPQVDATSYGWLQSPIYRGTGSTTYADNPIRPTNAGTYTLVASLPDGRGNVNYPFTINRKADVVKPTAITGLIYNGETRTGVSATPSNASLKSGSTTGIAAQSYSAVFQISNANYAWSDNTTADYTVSWSISNRTLVASDLNSDLSSKIYSGVSQGIPAISQKSPLSAIGAVTIKYDGSTTVPTNAGTYAVTVDIAAATNYNAVTNIALGNYTISQKTLVLGDINFDLSSKTYNNTALGIPAITTKGTLVSPASDKIAYTYKLDGTAVSPINAGTYEVTVTITAGGNYAGTTITLGNYKIAKREFFYVNWYTNDTLIYDGTEKTVYVRVDADTNILGEHRAGVTVAYASDLNKRTNAGSQVAYAEFSGLDLNNYEYKFTGHSYAFTIEKRTLIAADLDFDLSAKIYNASAQAVAVSQKAPLSPISATVKYDGSAAAPINAKTSYHVTVEIAEIDGGNYNAVTIDLGYYEIKKADPTDCTAPSDLSATYGDLLNTVIFADGRFAWADGTVTVGNAGTQTHLATFTPSDTDNYNVLYGVEVSVYVNKANPTYTKPNNLTAIYGERVATVNIVGTGFTWASGTDLVGNAGLQKHKATFTPDNTDNFNILYNIELEITVGKATPTISELPTASAITYLQNLTESELVGGLATFILGEVYGTFSWVPYANLPTVKNDGFDVIFTPDDGNNFESVTVTVALTVNKATPTYSVPVGLTATYGDLLSSISLDGTRFTWHDAAVKVGAPILTHTYYAYYTPADEDNFAVVENVAIEVITTKATLTITVEDKTKEYGAALPTWTVTYDGLIYPTDTQYIVGLSQERFIHGAVPQSSIGTYTVSLEGLTSLYYDIEYVSGTLTVTQATPSFTVPASLAATYGDLLSSVNLPSGFTWQNDTVTVGNVGLITHYATYTPADANYKTVTDIPVTIRVNKATPNYTEPTDLTAVYGQKLSDIALPSGWSWKRPNDAVGNHGKQTHVVIFTPADTDNFLSPEVSVTVTVSKASPNTTNPTITVQVFYGTRLQSIALPTGWRWNDPTAFVGNAGVVTHKASFNNGDENYETLLDVDVTFTVNKLAITVTAEGKEKKYGEANPTFTVRYGAFAVGDNYLSLGSGLYFECAATELSEVGYYDIIPMGLDPENYSVTFIKGTLTIKQATPEYTIPANLTATYGDILADVIGMTAGFTWDNDGLSVGVVGSRQFKAVFTPADTKNYETVTLMLTVTVTKAVLTVKADDKTKVYGASVPTATFVITGFVNGENENKLDGFLRLVHAVTQSSNVGDYAIVPSGLSSSNYEFNYVEGNFAVTKKDLTVTVDGISKVYGANVPNFSVSFDGFVLGEGRTALGGTASYSHLVTAASNVGEYGVSVTGFTSNNYEIAYVAGTLTVTPKALYVTTDNVSRVYGEENPTFTVTFDGFVLGQDASVLSGTLSFIYTVDALSNVGTYTVTPAGYTSENYALAFVGGILTVVKADPIYTLPEGLTATYGDRLSSVFISGGFTWDDSTLSVGAFGENRFTATFTPSNTQNYNILKGVLVTVSVGKKALTVTANGTKVYGSSDITFTLSYLGFVNGESFTVLSGTASYEHGVTLTTAVGNYGVKASGLINENYEITFAMGVLSVTKAALTVRAGNASKVYGEADLPTFSVSYTGFVNGETAAVLSGAIAFTCGVNRFSNVGTYEISVGGVNSGNYSITFVSGTLTVNRVALTVTAADKSRTYGAENPTFTANYAGFVNGENPNVLPGTLRFVCSADANSNVGRYTVTAAGLSAANYSITYVSGTLTVTKANLTVKADDAARAEAKRNPTFTASISGFVNGETRSALQGTLSFECEADTSSPAGTYAIVPKGLSSDNYDITFVAGVLTVCIDKLTNDDNSITITGNFDMDAELRAIYYDRTSENFDEIAGNYTNVITVEDNKIQQVVKFENIPTNHSGETLVRIKIADGTDLKSLRVMAFPADGSESYEVEFEISNGYVVFNTRNIAESYVLYSHTPASLKALSLALIISLPILAVIVLIALAWHKKSHH